MEFENLLKSLENLRKQYPNLKYIIAIIGVVIGIKVITLILGKSLGYIPIFLFTIIIMYIFYFFSKNSQNDKNGKNAQLAHRLSLFMLTIAMCFILASFSAVILGKPCTLVKLFEIKNGECMNSKIETKQIESFRIHMEGKIRNKEGKKIEGATIFLFDYPNIPKVSSDSYGNFKIESENKIDANKDIKIISKANGYNLKTKYVDVDAKNIVIEMED